MKRRCDYCGKAYEAKTKRSRYHSDACRKAADRHPERKAVEREAAAEEMVPGAVVAATRVELDAAGRTSSALGQAALAVALKIDGGVAETGSAFATLVKELRATLAAALGNTEVEGDIVDELKQQRQKRHRAAR